MDFDEEEWLMSKANHGQIVPESDLETFHKIYASRGEIEAVAILNLIRSDGFGERVRDVYFERISALLGLDGVLTGNNDPSGRLLPGYEELYWPTLKDFLLDEKGWPESVVDSIDQTSANVMNHVGNPGEEVFDRRGLVVGYVQSGKTAGYMAVLARAADAGFRLIIVLTGILDSLRNQTQGRLEDELLGRTPHWHRMTSRESDFNPGAANNLHTMINDTDDARVICVIKKNTHVLQSLLNWLRGAGAMVLKKCPTLIIDDEADQASINTGDRQTQNQRSAINGHITELLALLPRSAYVAYTATPFANVLVDPVDSMDLYPRDFIMSMPEPAGYFGASRVFGRLPLTEEDRDADLGGLDVVRDVPLSDIDALCTPSSSERDAFTPSMTPTLEEALRYFLLTCAARLARGHRSHHMSMLVHTSFYTVMHEKLAAMVLDWLAGSSTNLERATMEELWERECACVDAVAMDETPVSFEELSSHLPEVLERVDVVVENGKSERRLVYGKEPRIQIAVGGNSLSRGLTLEGLCVSYFLRHSMQYDTLLQMGRWFGYRHGYSDLPRIYTTALLAEAFEHLATVEEEIRRDIALYDRDGLTPEEFGVRVRTHPEMAITSPGKMSDAETCDISFSGRVVQTTHFAHADSEWLLGNIDATRNLLTSCEEASGKPTRIWNRHHLYRDVPANLIQTFLQTYTIHATHGHMSAELLSSYMEAQQSLGELERWNVAVVGRVQHRSGTLEDLLPGSELGLLNRSKLARTSTESMANLGVITSRADMAIDLGQDLPTLNKLSSVRQGELIREVRNPGDHSTRYPLLLVYPINSASPGDGKNRADLDAVEHIIGCAFVFPEARQITPQRYVRARLSPQGV